MMTPKAQKLVRDFRAWAVEEAFKGSAHPDDHSAIDEGYRQARKKLVAYITALEKVAS